LHYLAQLRKNSLNKAALTPVHKDNTTYDEQTTYTVYCVTLASQFSFTEVIMRRVMESIEFDREQLSME